MIRKILSWLAALVMLTGAASAEIYFGEDAPQEWADRDVMRLTFIDVGRSDCMLLESAGETMMIDGGYGGHTAEILGLLEERGIDRLTAMLNTHPHNDHLHGLTELMKKKLWADTFYSTVPLNYQSEWQEQAARQIRRAEIPYVVLTDGDDFQLGNVSVRVMQYDGLTGPNDRSAVLQLTFGDSTALLAGDVTYPAMQWLVANKPPYFLRGDVLKVPHHGITWVPDEFVDVVAPDAACVTNTEEKGRQGARPVQALGSPVFFTDSGSVEAVTDGTDWYIRQLDDRW